MKNMICDEGQALIQYFVEQTRELSKCARCSGLLHDPVKAKCGHLFCRTCMFKKIDNHIGSLQVRSYCAFCPDADSNYASEEVSLKIGTLSSCLQQFVKDFCSAGHFSVGSFIGREKSSETQPLFEENVHTEESNPAFESETSSCPKLISGPSSPSLTSHSAMAPALKVGQWLMTNLSEDPLTIQKEKNCRNGNGIKKSGTLSFQSLKVSPSSLTFSSNDKELSYDIVSAPSPPPPHEDVDPQVKQGRPRRGRGRPRKNALPISSGETFSKKRERSKSITPETKLTRVSTPFSHLSTSQDRDEAIASMATTKTVIAKTPSTISPLAKNNTLSQFEGSVQNNRNMLEGGTRRILVDADAQSSNEVIEKSADSIFRQCVDGMGDADVQSNNEVLEKSADSIFQQSVDGKHSLNHPADVPCATDEVENERYTNPIPANALNIPLLPLMSISSPQPEKSNWGPPTAHHLTPVSRPKTQNSATLTKNFHQTSAQKFRSHAPSPALTGERPTVSFFLKGPMTPRTSINSIKSQPVVFSRLGRLGPILDMPTSNRPFSAGSLFDTEKMFDIKETQTCPTPSISLASIATQTEAIEATRILTKESHLMDSKNQSQLDIIPKNTVNLDGLSILPFEQARGKGSDEILGTRDSDECSEDMFAEPFKRARVLSSSDNEMAEPKRRKSSAYVVVNAVPVCSTPVLVETNTALAKEIRRPSPELNALEAAACKTVVMESDADSDEGDILNPTPPRPLLLNPVPCKRRVFTCSSIPRPQIKMIEDWAQRIGAEVSLTYNSSVTHVIVCLDEENCAQRTLKFLYGVASGNWIVGVDWVHQCIRENRLIDEEPFEALDMDGEDGPRRARQTSQREKLFEAFEFCCQGPFTDVTVDQLNQLLQLCGAATVPSPSQLTKRRRYTMIVVQTEEDVNLEVGRKAVKWFDSLKVVSVSREWVLDCLAAYQLLPVRNQLIGKYSVSELKMMGFDARLVI